MCSQQQKFAFSLFRETPDNYKRSIIVSLHDFIAEHEAITDSRLRFEFTRAHNVPKDDFKAALTALKSPLGFDALHIWRTKQTKKTLIKVKPSTAYTSWIS